VKPDIPASEPALVGRGTNEQSSPSLIVAMTPDRIIGRAGQLPWRLSADLQRFKRLTMGHHLIMGRRTFASIGRVLPGRVTLVVSRQLDLAIPGVQVVHSVEEALAASQSDPEPFIVGGQQIYAASLTLVDRIYLTLVHAQVAGDAFFPEFDQRGWQVRESEFRPADARNEYAMTFQTLVRSACHECGDGSGTTAVDRRTAAGDFGR
jgi:dihydrofolate reductase